MNLVSFCKIQAIIYCDYYSTKMSKYASENVLKICVLSEKENSYNRGKVTTNANSIVRTVSLRMATDRENRKEKERRMMIKKKGKRLGALALVAMMAFSAIGCGSASKEKTADGKKGDAKTEVTIGYFDNITHAQALLMKHDGTLEEAYKDQASVSWQSFNAGPAEVEALFSGDIDIGYIGPVPAVTANVKSNSDVVVLAGATQGGAVLLKRAGGGIETVADLDGKTVAIPQLGNTQHLSLLHLLSENGLKPDTSGGTVKVSAVANADVENMMERGDIDAALVPEPWGATLMEKGAEMVLDYDQVYMDGKYDVAVVVVRKEFMEEHPDLVDEFMEQHQLATDTILSDEEASLDKINAQINEETGKSLTKDILTEAFGRIGVSTDINKESLKGFAEISKEEGFITEVPGEDVLYAK